MNLMPGKKQNQIIVWFSYKKKMINKNIINYLFETLRSMMDVRDIANSLCLGLLDDSNFNNRTCLLTYRLHNLW